MVSHYVGRTENTKSSIKKRKKTKTVPSWCERSGPRPSGTEGREGDKSRGLDVRIQVDTPDLLRIRLSSEAVYYTLIRFPHPRQLHQHQHRTHQQRFPKARVASTFPWCECILLHVTLNVSFCAPT
jgi:hypothetical protein